MTEVHSERRRTLLQWLAGSAVATGMGAGAGVAVAAPQGKEAGKNVARIGDAALGLEFDGQMKSRLLARKGGATVAVTGFHASERLRVTGGRWIDSFALGAQAVDRVDGPHGAGVRHRLTGVSKEGVEKTVLVTFYERHPGMAVLRVSYRNNGQTALPVEAWSNSGYTLLPARRAPGRGFWTFSGSSHADRRDWVQPLKDGFEQRNFMGMNSSDYGGGTPVADVWQPEHGIAVGHLDTVPRLVALPVQQVKAGAALAIEFEQAVVLQPGQELTTLDTFGTVHTGDYFAALDRYRLVMAERGLAAPQAGEESYEPIWCAWGYERDFTIPLMTGTLAKAKELGLEWAVLDDGWQTNEGDWKIDRKKFARGEEDMKKLVDDIRGAGLKARLWLAPLAADPGTDLLHQHTDQLLLDENGAPQFVTWWNALTLCPAYEPVIEQTRALVRKIIGEWGYEGLKLDGQHLNGVAPCHNPAHNHARPEESFEKLQDFWKMVYDTAREINPKAVVEFCPCGTSYAFHTLPYTNQAPSSDPLSSWQVRHKGKTLKALMGPTAAYAGDHVELSDGGDDFASSVGIGAVVSTKFTWPEDPKPKDSYLLTAVKEAKWRKWIGIYKDKMLPKGQYRGELYDIGFDKPETHAVEKDGRLYFAFYAKEWSGQVELRGLKEGRYRVRDYVEDRDLGEVSAASNKLKIGFEQALLLEAIPV
ncbi:glycoside hydrolase family 36 protein [Massilia oculi]|uniref:Alpha-galactosidase n=1 Tax=Massilia oculi TaxID=945844 RepID=A0A2S2DGS1_9BURK|nr:glycoside hydrolase family 36 protein [Massilia oculi]AWL04524.1 alpha-galactosidase [Massilia oculi]